MSPGGFRSVGPLVPVNGVTNQKFNQGRTARLVVVLRLLSLWVPHGRRAPIPPPVEGGRTSLSPCGTVTEIQLPVEVPGLFVCPVLDLRIGGGFTLRTDPKEWVPLNVYSTTDRMEPKETTLKTLEL